MTKAEAALGLAWFVGSLAVGSYLAWWWWPTGITEMPLSSLTSWMILNAVLSILSVPASLAIGAVGAGLDVGRQIPYPRRKGSDPF
jgi:hypothetical protein